MTHQVRNNSKSMACSKRHRVLALASAALVLGAGAIMGSLPAIAGDNNNSDNSAGEGNFDHSGIYSILQAPPGDFSGPSADATGDRRYYYLQGRGWVPFNVRSGRSVRGN